MKHLIFMMITFTVISTGAIAADNQKGKISENITISGILVDNHCADAHKSSMEQFIKSHTKECALMPDCAASGYSLYHYGALLRFDKESSKKVEQFLRKKGNRLDVVVVVKKAGEKYSLVSIKNK
ncbi:MAG TPA: hypothetical protein PK307_03840 [Spirochaetota bacterium]|nr:hypothetical protein [Spirochaetota bacterium]HOD13987.1 hypothetical protein [Spirochaetota bacterium]HPG52096.1 hypothetical protein [Spirochaetota bacterium]HPN11356.1 hypothetical protein [Spirochaetota bacterium]HQL81306.1 hypothetical protein [Spirochaetota bacterium]